MIFDQHTIPRDPQPHWFIAHGAVTTEAEWRDLLAWCVETFGEAGETGDRWSYDGLNGVYFRDATDAIAFKLRWY